MSFACFWKSACGQGGPMISPGQVRKLGELNVELWLDIYGPDENVPDQPLQGEIGPERQSSSF